VVQLSEATFALCYAGIDAKILPWLKSTLLAHRPSTYQSALDVATHAAREAGQRLRDEFHRPGGPRGDGDKDPIDREVEMLIRMRIDRAFPEHGIFSEEAPEENRPPTDPEGHTWLIDPNDGTSGFHRGYRGASVSIALLRDGVPVLGVIYAYAAPNDDGDLLAWAEGCGPMTRNGVAVERPPWTTTLTAQTIVVVSHLADTRAVANGLCVHPARYQTIPGIAYRLALVAAGDGEAAVSIGGSRSFDVAAGDALLRAQGGVLLDRNGAPIVYTREGNATVGMCVGGAPAIAQQLLGRPWSTVFQASDSTPEPLDQVQPLQGSPACDNGLLDRATGVLSGAVIGDALGSLVSFQAPASILRRYPNGLRELSHNPTWGTLAGQPTDTTESLLTLARALVAAEGMDEEQIIRAYVWWYMSRPFDMDRVTEHVLEVVAKADDAADWASIARHEAGQHANKQGNGALVRIAPLAILGHRAHPQVVASWAVADTSMSHAHPVCRDAGVVLAVAMAHAVATGRGPSDVYAYALRKAQELSLHRNVLRTLENAGTRAPRDYTHRPGWVLIALQNAFHQLVFAPDAEQGLIDTVMRGGDADANAAIVGSLLGAVYGHTGWPERWSRTVLT
ncbi:MAG: inositol monophosphatase family protein, partial [Myxococcota bacterium]